MDRLDADILIETQKCTALKAEWLAAIAARNELEVLLQKASVRADTARAPLMWLTGSCPHAIEQIRQEEAQWRQLSQERDNCALRLDLAQSSASRLSKAYSDQQRLIDRLIKQHMAKFWTARQEGGANNGSSGSRPQAPPPYPGGGFPFNFADSSSSSYTKTPPPPFPGGGSNPYKSANTFAPTLQERARIWYESTQPAIDYANLTSFPTPPAFSGLGCQKVACKQNPSALAPTCRCSVRAGFEALGVDLKKERLRWHPDKFAVCRDTKMQEMAKEVFVVLEEMYNGA